MVVVTEGVQRCFNTTFVHGADTPFVLNIDNTVA